MRGSGGQEQKENSIGYKTTNQLHCKVVSIIYISYRGIYGWKLSLNSKTSK
jgi:hypothetical protein